MATIPAQFWMLKKTGLNGETQYKPASGTSATPKLYRSRKIAIAAGRNYDGWTAVPVSINFL